MAEKRMFAKAIIDSDAFLEMPMSARLLYYDLGMRADDDGFINSPKKIMRTIGATEDDLNILAFRKFIIPFNNGIVVIKHWRINNYLRKDRYSETTYTDEKSTLLIDKNGAYTLHSDDEKPSGIPLGLPHGIPHGLPVVTEDKNRIDKNILCANFFEQIWQMYPNKRGKAQVSASKKQCLHDIGLEEMTRAINRYKKDLTNEPWRKPQNGSTFFNSGYVDYLDANYEDKPIQTAKPVQASEIPEGWL